MCGLALIVVGIGGADRVGSGAVTAGVLMVVIWGAALVLRASRPHAHPWSRRARIGLTVVGFLLGLSFIYWMVAVVVLPTRHGDATLDNCRRGRVRLPSHCEAHVRWAGGGTSTVVVDTSLRDGTRVPVIDAHGVVIRPPWPDPAAYLLVGLLLTAQACVSTVGLVTERRRGGWADPDAVHDAPRPDARSPLA